MCGQVQAGFVDFLAKNSNQHQRQHAVEGMHANLLGLLLVVHAVDHTAVEAHHAQRGDKLGKNAEIGVRVFQQGEVIRDRFSDKRLDRVKLPDEDAGLVMIFRTFEKVSFGLVMKATSAIHINDYVRTP